MIPSKEIKELADALKQSEEYKNMAISKEKVDQKARMNSFASAFTNQEEDLFNSDMTIRQISDKINHFINKGRNFANSDDIKNYLNDMEKYHKLLNDTMQMLYQMLE